MKKSISIALLASIMVMNFTPCLALAKSNDNEFKSPAQFKSMVTKNKKENDTYKYEYVNLDWWKNFNDSNLNDYILKAVINNYDLKMATIATREYYQNVRAQLASELPQMTAGYAPNYVKHPGTTDWGGFFALPAIVNYEADIFLKNRDKTKSVKKLYEASLFDERASYISVASAVGTTYLNLVSLDRMIELQEDIVELRKEIYDLMLKRNKEGITSTSDTVKANKALISGQTELIEYKKQRQQLAHQLAVLIGESPENASNLAVTPYESINFTGVIPAEISTEVITQRPDYLKAEKMVEKAGIDVRVAKKEFLPSFNLTGLALFNASQFGSLFSTKGMLASLGGSAMLPLFRGGSLIANLKLKKEQYERILQNYYKTNLTSIQEVNDSLVAIKRDKEKLDATLEQAKLERADFGYSQDKFNQGIISKLDLIQVKENLMVIDKAVAGQQVNCYVDYIGLYKAAGSKI
ncbi:efflux transporter outer membrane subunit [bacterium]|nr:efflux transporter outer membrane subunit [bacterium]